MASPKAAPHSLLFVSACCHQAAAEGYIWIMPSGAFYDLPSPLLCFCLMRGRWRQGVVAASLFQGSLLNLACYGSAGCMLTTCPQRCNIEVRLMHWHVCISIQGPIQGCVYMLIYTVCSWLTWRSPWPSAVSVLRVCVHAHTCTAGPSLWETVLSHLSFTPWK